MSVKNIENVSIPGFGAYNLYSFQYSPGFSDSAGSIEAEFINSTGIYSTINLNQDTFFQIVIKNGNGASSKLGNFTIASYEINKTSQFKVLKVKFVDKSIELDRFIVALRGQMGYDAFAISDMGSDERLTIIGSAPTGTRLIWVGESDDACKEDLLETSQGQDPCDPCERAEDGSIINRIDCNKYYLTKKRVYNYSVKTLISALNSAGIGLTFSGLNFDDYKFEYTGTIRQVLNNICSEIGMSFYYDANNNKIQFIDIRNGIDINVKNLYNETIKNKILEESIKHSKEGSTDVFGVASFQREAEEKTYKCETGSCKKLKLNPILLDDLLVEAAHFEKDTIINSELFARLEFYSMLCGRVKRDFRDMFLWYQEYNFNKASDVKAKIGKTLSALNGMKIKKVFSADSALAEDQMMYRLLLSIYSAKDFEGVKKKAIEAKAYFFLAEVDEKEDEKIHNLETSLCNDFIGKYWIRKYKKHWTGISYNAISPSGDSLQYYDFKNPINLPFSEIITQSGGVLEDSEIFKRTDKESFFFMNRSAIYSPLKFEDSVLENIELNLNKYFYKEIEISPDLEKKIKSLTDMDNNKEYDKKIHKLYVMPNELGNSSSISLRITKAVHPEEQPNVIIPVNVCNKQTSYGLESAETKRFDIAFKEVRFSLLMPPQSYSGETHSGYTAIIERSGDNKPVILPKLEVFSYGSGPKLNSPSLSSNFNFYSSSSNDLKFLARTGSITPFCKLKDSDIKTLLKKLSDIMNYSVGNKEERTYKIEGLSYDNYTPIDGLKSFSINIGSSGLTTSLSFDNTFAFRLNPENILKKMKYLRLTQIQRQFAAGSPLEYKGDGLQSVL